MQLRQSLPLLGLALGLAFAAPSFAQDAADDTAAAAPATDSAPSSDEGSAADSGHRKLPVYAGVDYAFLTASLSKDSLKTALGGKDTYDSSFTRLRVGARVLPFIGVEAQYGVKGFGGNDVDTDQMYGLFVVPTGVLFDLVEVSAPIGFSHLELKDSTGKARFTGTSFGLNAEVPIYVGDNRYIPAIRLGGGGTVYYAKGEARVYGFQAGLRFDFNL